MSSGHAIKNSHNLEHTHEEDHQRLRSLVLGEELETFLNKKVKQDEIQHTAEILTEAFTIRNKMDSSLTEELSPILSKSIESSIKQNRLSFADVIYPVIGPAVRKAVANALSDMIYSLNQLLKKSLSARAIIWRFKAWFSGIPYSQFVILQNLQFRVEQVFLIHRETGLLIESCSAKDISSQDPDLISAMLTAITDFIKDSFNQVQNTQNTDTLNSIQFGEWNLLIETGPYATIALAIRGNVHKDIKDRLQEICEAIHSEFSSQLKLYSGDNTFLEGCYPLLEDALIEKQKPVEKSYPWLAIVVLMLIGIITSYSIYITYTNNKNMEHLIGEIIKKIQLEKGYQIISHQYNNNELNINLLKSPTSRPINQVISKNKTPKLKINITDMNASIYDPQLFLPVLEHKYLIKFQSISTDNGIKLIAEGTLPEDQLKALAIDPMVKNLFSEFDTSQVKIQLPRNRLAELDTEFLALVEDINNINIYFEHRLSVIINESHNTLSTLINQLNILQKISLESSYSITQITVLGLADREGRNSANLSISKKRAQLIASQLKANGINENIIVAWGLGAIDLPNVPLEQQRRVNIRVLFHQKVE
ncbi:OmpA family protein [Spartinivicinus ruber]|uniref:OmpA family protein n=1 Tax=Spartinivicinus ruber TaxID=2683272 RepID=UPI0013CF5B23|nr:OmpA family protein [Spartinivicinus ruber]